MNYISLGYFCSVASELEKFGLRKESSPFDWVISDFEGVIMAIKNDFLNYLDYDYLSQCALNHEIYKNTKYNIMFVHDFDRYIPLKKQLPKVLDKYNRRISRFYESIKKPTLFIRYISDEESVNGVSKELLYIEKNYDRILKMLKTFNSSNEILFIANGGVSSSKVSIYHVTKDDNDKVSRSPFSANSDLYRKFSTEEVPNKQKNIDRYLRKEKHKKLFVIVLKRKIVSVLKRIFLQEYVHEKQF